jgi:hypothetical protein
LPGGDDFETHLGKTLDINNPRSARYHSFYHILPEFHHLLLDELRKASLDRHPINIIMKTGHSPKYIAVVALDLFECVPTSSFLMPSVTSPEVPTVSLNVFIMCEDATQSRCPFAETVGVEMGES